jgi:putative membrane protein
MKDMIGFILRVSVVALGLWLASELVAGIEVKDAGTLLGAALLLGVVNAVVRPLVVILTPTCHDPHAWPISAGDQRRHARACRARIDNFSISGFWSALFGSIVVSITSWIASWFIGPRGRIEVIVVHHRS